MTTIRFSVSGARVVGFSAIGAGATGGSEAAVALVPSQTSSGGTAGTVAVHDINFSTLSGSGVQTYSNLNITPSSLASGSVSIVNNSPTVVASVSPAGVVTPVPGISGTADITIVSGPSRQRVQFPVTTAVAAAITGVSGFAVTTSLQYHVWSQIHAMCNLASGPTSANQYYYSDTGGTVVNGAFAPVLTYGSAWTPPTGFGTAVTYVPLNATALNTLIAGSNMIPVAANHCLCAAHCAGVYNIADGAYNATGQVQASVTRGQATYTSAGASTGTAALTSAWVTGSSDLAVVYVENGQKVGNLTAPFTNFAQILPANWANYLPVTQVASPAGYSSVALSFLAPLPVWVARHHDNSGGNTYANGGNGGTINGVPAYLSSGANLNTFDLFGILANATEQPAQLKAPDDANRQKWTGLGIYQGDSGSSFFIPVNGQPVLVGVASFGSLLGSETTISTGYSDWIANFQTQINAAILAATALRNAIPGVTVDNSTPVVQTANISGFTQP